MKTLSLTWQKVIVWVTAYLNVIAFFLAGGYLYLRSEQDEIRSSAKNAFGVTVVFAGLGLLRSVLYNVLSLADAPYRTLNVISDIGLALSILQGLTYAVLLVLDLNGIQFPFSAQKKSAIPEETESL